MPSWHAGPSCSQVLWLGYFRKVSFFVQAMIAIAALLVGAAAIRDASNRDDCHCGFEYSGVCSENMVFDPATAKPCCPFFTECDPASYQAQRGIHHYCNFEKHGVGLGMPGLFADPFDVDGKCDKLECANVKDAISQSWKKGQDKMTKNNDALSKMFESKRPKITGQSNKYGVLKRCACGKFNEGTGKCAVVGKSSEKPCCTKEKDCKPDDEWIKEAKEWEMTLKKAEDDHIQLVELTRKQTEIMKSLHKECLNQCHSRYAEICFHDLKEKVEGSKSRLEALLLQNPNHNRDLWLKDKKERFQRIASKAQETPREFIDLSTWDGELSESTSQCCKCPGQVSGSLVPVINLCMAAECPSSCQTLPEPRFCGKNTKDCN